MKFLISSSLILFFCLMPFVGLTQVEPKDTVVSMLIVTQRQCVDRPIIRWVKQSNDFGIVINTKEKDMLVFKNGYCTYAAKITDFDLDTSGLIEIRFDVCFKKGMGEIPSIPGNLTYQLGTNALKITVEEKKRKHTKITYEFSKVKYF